MDECDNVLETDKDPQQVSRAKYRKAELLQNTLDFQPAVEIYEQLLKGDQPLMKEKALMRLAECCYRLEKIDQGLAYLEQLEKEIRPRTIYTICLLKGKFQDLIKRFDVAATFYEEALVLYSKEFANQIDLNVLGNIQFRLGWSLIRSRKDIDGGIKNLVGAN
jgi:tetratricopeptide (TPR) repeat protein